MAEEQRATWTFDEAMELAEKYGPQWMTEEVARQMARMGHLRPIPPAADNALRAAAVIRERRERDQAQFVARSTSAAEQSATAADRAAAAAEQAVNLGAEATKASERSAAAGEEAAGAARASADIARDTLKWSRLAAISAFGAFAVAIIALFIASCSSR